MQQGAQVLVDKSQHVMEIYISWVLYHGYIAEISWIYHGNRGDAVEIPWRYHAGITETWCRYDGYTSVFVDVGGCLWLMILPFCLTSLISQGKLKLVGKGAREIKTDQVKQLVVLAGK